jgi:glyoxylase-like metal-dependent hydrolase (beta-lactamase superfamily II)
MRSTPDAALATALPDPQAAYAAPDAAAPQAVPEVPWLLRFPLRSPTLPPATHTNAYLVGEDTLLVVDPGTPDVAELNRLVRLLTTLRSQGRRLAGVLLTHHHRDHASGAPFLKQALGLPVYAHPVTAERIAAEFSTTVEHPVHEGDLLPVGPAGLRALHTPGHAPGHLCFADAASGEIIAGDMVASVGTILIHPDDDGDMRQYLQSLHRLRRLAPRRLWPAHGAAIEHSAALLDHYIAHRQLREDKVVAALKAVPAPATVEQLVALAYADTPVALHGLAAGSLRAHLHKLRDEGRALLDPDGRWRLSPPTAG